MLAVVDQARASVKSAAAGYRGRIRVALSDGIPQARLAALLAQSDEVAMGWWPNRSGSIRW